MTHADVGARLGISRARAWQLDQPTLPKIRRGLLGDPAVLDLLRDMGLAGEPQENGRRR